MRLLSSPLASRLFAFIAITVVRYFILKIHLYVHVRKPTDGRMSAESLALSVSVCLSLYAHAKMKNEPSAFICNFSYVYVYVFMY